MYKDVKYPSRLLENAVEAIGGLPGIGERSALRLALHLLRQPAENVHHFTEAINALRDNVCYCRQCQMISEEPICSICADERRDHRMICVVESVNDVMSIERTGQYHGVYHVLGGIISPIAGVGPHDLNISSLKDRVAALCASGANSGLEAATDVAVEVIMALPGDVEGETTAFYIYRQIRNLGEVKVTTIARGLGFGDGLQYADSFTLGRSIAGRLPFSAK